MSTTLPSPPARSPDTTGRTPTWAARATVLSAATLTLMAAAVIAPSLPVMSQVHAGTPGSDILVRLALTITSLAIAISAPLSGVVADRLGRRPLLVSGLVLYAFAGTAGFVSTDLRFLLITRALLGLAVGGIMTAISATITDWFDGPRRAAFLGLQQAFASAGGVVFLPAAGLLATVDWKAPFLLYAVSIAVLPSAVFALREPSRPARTEPGPAFPSPKAPRQETLPVAGIYLLALVVTLVFFMAPTQLPFLLTAFDAGPALAGAVIAGSTLTGAVGALAFSSVRRRLTSARITMVSVALMGAGWLSIGTAGTLVQVIGGLLVGGIGVGLVVPNLNLRLGELADSRLRGRILGGLVAAIFLGQFLSPLAVQPLIGAAGLAGAFTVTGVAMAIAAVIAMVVSVVRR
ncbi:MFS transporter [Amycolatopsis sp. YIM 10]|uniref:MFS transporter n=1 Tax=Amycolatopsis sp. YIM 10 TaxID=2653857 RepID=UPI0012907F34|nr:MFS transporter [Amycolatopsis sp. YIM 10]QFU91987.1 Bacillibactin exporter [Amycolatopsis sp. YIM 10]